MNGARIGDDAGVLLFVGQFPEGRCDQDEPGQARENPVDVERRPSYRELNP
jgi:hypothetical protein